MVYAVITMDGPAGAGKSTVARRVASCLGLAYLDTGALYRAVSFFLDSQGIAPEEGLVLQQALKELDVVLKEGRIWIGSQDVSDALRTPRVDAMVSAYAALGSVRARLLDLQRSQLLEGGLVAEGRDMGTVIFPRATLKIFLSATDEERARRRYEELRDRGVNVAYDDVLQGVRERDALDESRAIAPLRAAEDAIRVETDGMTLDAVVAHIVTLFRKAASPGA